MYVYISLTLPDDDIVDAEGVPDDCALKVARLVFDCIAITTNGHKPKLNQNWLLFSFFF